MIITESKEGLGLPGEVNIPDGPQQPIDMGLFGDREVIVWSDDAVGISSI